jgi:enamine deaminase RidA (YjgF/YER057c/UK114 family)
VIHVIEYVRADGLERYGELAAARAALFGNSQPTINTVLVQSLLRQDALVELEVVAGMQPRPAASNKWGIHESNGIVYLPSVHPTDDAGKVMGAGDLVAQTAAVFDKARRMLDAVGLSFSNVVQTIDYIVPEARPQYRKSGSVRKEHLGPVYPTAAGIIMPRMQHRDSLIQYDFVASREKPVAVNPGWKRYDNLSYGPGVRAGKFLFMSGFGALEPETEKILFAGDVVAQSDYIYRNILSVVAAAGGTAENIVKTIEYVAPPALGRYREVATVRRSLLREPLPVSTGIVCEGLLLRDMLLEVVPLAILD